MDGMDADELANMLAKFFTVSVATDFNLRQGGELHKGPGGHQQEHEGTLQMGNLVHVFNQFESAMSVAFPGWPEDSYALDTFLAQINVGSDGDVGFLAFETGNLARVSHSGFVTISVDRSFQ